MKIIFEKLYEIINSFYRKFCRQDDGILWTPSWNASSRVSSALDTSEERFPRALNS